tara:strand:+ start:145 stop:636 length:492 start_codon:yes stop_codon:yes gene_type:complete
MTEKGRGYMPQPVRLDWGTPQYIFEYAVKRWGVHHIDLAASKENTKCSLYIDEEENALDGDWGRYHVRGWLNPPYGKMLKPFAKQVSHQLTTGNIESVTILVPSRTDTEWFSILMRHAVEVVFIRGRLKFEGAENSAPFPSVLIHMKRTGKQTVPTDYSVKID